MEKRPELPIGIGDKPAQDKFIREQEPFLLEYPNVHDLVRKVFRRPFQYRPDDQVQNFASLSDSDPALISFMDKVLASRMVFFLGRAASVDFREVLVLAGNGYGIGALKILRGMYERIVTTVYISKNPAEARVFIEDSPIKRGRLWKELSKAYPELRNRYNEDQIQTLEGIYAAARAKRKASFCPKCGQPKTQEEWTRINLYDMAQKSGEQLIDLYASCYLDPTFHSHATIYGLEQRITQPRENAYTFDENSHAEGTRALSLAHSLLLRLLWHQNEYFKLGLEDDLKRRAEAFSKVWNSIYETFPVKSY